MQINVFVELVSFKAKMKIIKTHTHGFLFVLVCPQLRSYSRHDLLMDPFEDNMSEIRFRRKVELERRVSFDTDCGSEYESLFRDVDLCAETGL